MTYKKASAGSILKILITGFRGAFLSLPAMDPFSLIGIKVVVISPLRV
jgi:hypothetical protein